MLNLLRVFVLGRRWQLDNGESNTMFLNPFEPYDNNSAASSSSIWIYGETLPKVLEGQVCDVIL